VALPSETGINHSGCIKAWEFWLAERLLDSQSELRTNAVTSSHVGHKV
jgi:hypothetical protein